MTPHDTADGERVLLPCPKGHKAEIRCDDAYSEVPTQYIAQCSVCEWSNGTWDTKDAAIEAWNTRALQTAQPAVQPDEPPCGDKCPKDGDCGNFNFHGEGCAYDPKISKVKVWKAIKALAQAKFDFQVPMAANRTGAMLISEQVDLIEAALSFAYHKAEDTGEKYE